MVKSGNKKWDDFILLGIGIVALILINLLAGSYPVRLDLTEEKRFTISEATKDLLENLEDVVYIEVYLEGDFPSGFRRLQRSVRETLEEFRSIGGRKIQFTFVNPATGRTGQARNEYYIKLAEKGIQPTNLFDTEDGNKTEKLIFPGALVSYGGNEKGVMLLKGNPAAPAEERLNQSVEGVEYELATAIRHAMRGKKNKIALLKGHGEADSQHLQGLREALSQTYIVESIDLTRREDLREYAAVLMVKPVNPVSEVDKLNLDQYIMAGGKALFFVDAMEVRRDSIGREYNFALPYNHNLDDQFFNYGIRINQNLIQDLTSGAQPIVVGNMGDQPQIKMVPWPFYPVINTFGDHPAVKNLNMVYTKYISSMDTVKAQGVKKTPLMFTSQYSRIIPSPVRVTVADLRGDIREEAYNQRFLPVAFLLEGEFSSLYRNRILPAGVDKNNFLEKGTSQIFICADGDLAQNEINTRSNQPYPLGYDPYSQFTFSNQELVLNVLEYLLDEKGLITARAKEIKIRPLDKFKIENEKIFWQLVNLLVPVGIIILYGVIRYYIRKRKYTGF